MENIEVIIQVIIALGIFNVWIIRRKNPQYTEEVTLIIWSPNLKHTDLKIVS